jgi:predicted nucleotidyltransferase
VYVGGATLSLYATRATFDVRATDDIDVIIEIYSFAENAKLAIKLLEIGFQPEIESSVMCRYSVQGIIIDIMPTQLSNFGTYNIWYQEGFFFAQPYKLDESTTIKILSAPYFIATKLEAFKSRGQNDGRTSHDFEDIIYILENRHTIWSELQEAPPRVKLYLIHELYKLSKQPDFFEWINCHIEFQNSSVTHDVLKNIKTFIRNNQF